jgi:hypothetical protein
MIEKERLLAKDIEDSGEEVVKQKTTARSVPAVYAVVSCCTNLILLLAVWFLGSKRKFTDPSVQLYCELI